MLLLAFAARRGLTRRSIDFMAPYCEMHALQQAFQAHAVHAAQVWMAVIARCLLHVVYEFQAFLNLFAKQSLGLSSGMAAQVRDDNGRF